MQWALCLTYSFYQHRIHWKTCLSHTRTPLTILSEYKRNFLPLSERFACVLRVIVLNFLLFHAALFLLKLNAKFL